MNRLIALANNQRLTVRCVTGGKIEICLGLWWRDDCYKYFHLYI